MAYYDQALFDKLTVFGLNIHYILNLHRFSLNQLSYALIIYPTEILLIFHRLVFQTWIYCALSNIYYIFIWYFRRKPRKFLRQLIHQRKKKALRRKQLLRNQILDEVKSKPNIILIMTDDQDVELGSLQFMPKLKKYLMDGGWSGYLSVHTNY